MRKHMVVYGLLTAVGLSPMRALEGDEDLDYEMSINNLVLNMLFNLRCS